MGAWSYIRQLVGNGSAATVGIFAFIALTVVMFARCSPAHSAEIDFQAGSSFGTEGTGPVVGMNLRVPFTANPGVAANFGTDLWGSTTYKGSTVPNNWDWHATLDGCKWRICFGIGPAFVQRVDVINGARTDYYLGIKYQIAPRWIAVLGHISDAGTSNPNVGRQALTLSYRLQ